MVSEILGVAYQFINGGVLILVLVEDGLGAQLRPSQARNWRVLILVLVEDGLGVIPFSLKSWRTASLNPCSSGRWSRSERRAVPYNKQLKGLNPCSSGRWSRSYYPCTEDGTDIVLILVLVEDGLGERIAGLCKSRRHCLNPCSSGRWSRSNEQLAPYYNAIRS